MKIILSLVVSFLWSLYCTADELKLSYLEIKEVQSQHYSIQLKLPINENKKLPLEIHLAQNCITSLPKSIRITNNTHIEYWQIKCRKSLENSILSVEGLKSTGTDLLLRLEFLPGITHIKLLNPSKSSYHIPSKQSYWQIIKTYIWLGVTHILLGFDHLLFVFALLLIVKNIRPLLWTITAFTFAHSLTMVGATLGLVSLPQAPVEAIIALSILFLAMEILHEKQGKIGLTSRHPWSIAFIFGLLHGFGFAGALAEIGLPQQAISLALIFFNIGVELGQLTFILTVVLIVLLLQRLNYPKLLNKLQIVVVYTIGSLSAFWLIERTLSF